jgi:DNA-binding transcriptional LysR family regulator
MSQLEDMRILVEIVDRGSFSAAALRLGQTKQLISRRIMALEDRLGVQLLVRTTRKLTLTELGLEYVERARRILVDVDDADQAMTSHVTQPKGTLRITTPLSFGQSHLSDILAGFLSLHPDVKLDLDMTDRPTDLIAERYDLAIRIGTLRDSSLIARRLMAVHLAICGTPAYFARFGTPETLADLKSHNCLEYRHSTGTAWPLTIAGKLEHVPVSGRYCANNGDVLRDAALAGLGLVQLPTFIIQPEVDQGRLITVLDDHAPPPSGAYIVYPGHRQHSRLVRVFTDYITANLGHKA